MKIKYVGDEDIYSGWDGDQIVNLTVGETGEVSDTKAAQLAEDRPYDFEIDGKSAQKRPRAQAPAADPDAPVTTIDELMKATRGQLDTRAKNHGIDPAGMPDKRTVANAILAAIDEAGAE